MASSSRWRVVYRDETGQIQELEAHAVVSAVGQLNRPAMPEIEGLASFEGKMWHSARWQEEDLAGKRVGVIGTGCSSVQLLPKTAERAGHTTVFQRTPHWVAPARDYYKPVEPGLIWALKHMPYYAEFHRARMILVFGDRSWPAVVSDLHSSLAGLCEGLPELSSLRHHRQTAAARAASASSSSPRPKTRRGRSTT